MKAIYRVAYILFKSVFKTFFGLKVYGRHYLPRGKALIAANHQSYVDPLVVGSAMLEEMWYLAREDLFKFRPFAWLCVKVNTIPVRRRHADRSALKAVLQKLGEGRKVLVFPEGTRSYDGRLQTPERGMALLAHKSDAPVVPAYVSGTFQVLPRGRRMVRPHPISVSFGAPLRLDAESLNAGARQAYESFSQQVMNAIAALKAEVEMHPVEKSSTPSPRRF